MSDIISESPGAPDYAEIEKGNPVATADAISLLQGSIQQEAVLRQAAIGQVLPDLEDQEWVAFIGGGF